MAKVANVVKVLDGKIVLTEDEKPLFRQAFWSTYQTIASDANLENESKKVVTEVVLDASYIKTYGHLTSEQYTRFDKWVQQEIADAKDINAGFRKLQKFFYER